jgi:hypothetical protein
MSKERQYNGQTKQKKTMIYKKSHQKWDFFQNYIKFTKDPKQTKILILQFAKSIAVGHSYFWKNNSIFSPTTTWSPVKIHVWQVLVCDVIVRCKNRDAFIKKNKKNCMY